jgi:hypothetical protein
MTISTIKSASLIATLMLAATTQAQASIIISEVDPNGSGSAYAADWFELTNTDLVNAVDITGWKMDDNSNLFANSVAIRGVTSIAAGQSVVFLEGAALSANDATLDANYKSAWFGTNIPTGFVVGNYGGTGVGLSATADAVNIFDAAGTVVTRVDFGVTTLAGGTLDNAAGLTGVTISTKSAVGTNGAFTSFNSAEIGSPGLITASAVPVPAAVWLFLTGFMGFLGLNRKRKSA